jgi:hypothetical protein
MGLEGLQRLKRRFGRFVPPGWWAQQLNQRLAAAFAAEPAFKGRTAIGADPFHGFGAHL